MSPDDTNEAAAPDRALRGRFLAILLIEAAVIAGLWAFGWYYGR